MQQPQQQQSYQNWTFPDTPSNNFNNFSGFGSPPLGTNGFYYTSNMTNEMITQPSPFGAKAAFGNPFMVSFITRHQEMAKIQILLDQIDIKCAFDGYKTFFIHIFFLSFSIVSDKWCCRCEYQQSIFMKYESDKNLVSFIS